MIYADHAATTMLSPKAREAMGTHPRSIALREIRARLLLMPELKLLRQLKLSRTKFSLHRVALSLTIGHCWEQHCVFQTKGNASLRAVLSTMLFCILVNSLRNLGTKSYISLLIVSV